MKERDLCSCFHSPVFLHSYTYYQFLKQPDTVTDTRTVTRTKIHRINSILSIIRSHFTFKMYLINSLGSRFTGSVCMWNSSRKNKILIGCNCISMFSDTIPAVTIHTIDEYKLINRCSTTTRQNLP